MGYDVEGWHDLFVASAGAAAALAGLVFVAVSINIENILKYAWLPARAFRTVAMLIVVVIVAIFGLVPQSTDALGIELLVLGLLSCALLVRLWARHRPDRTVTKRGSFGEVLPDVLGTAPFVVAGVSVLAGTGGGLYWALAGVVLATVGAVLNAWVLLVEILR
jgi:modulator of FtsH protease